MEGLAMPLAARKLPRRRPKKCPGFDGLGIRPDRDRRCMGVRGGLVDSPQALRSLTKPENELDTLDSLLDRGYPDHIAPRYLP